MEPGGSQSEVYEDLILAICVDHRFAQGAGRSEEFARNRLFKRCTIDSHRLELGVAYPVVRKWREMRLSAVEAVYRISACSRFKQKAM